MVGYYDLAYNILVDININEFFKIVTENPGTKVLFTTRGVLYSINDKGVDKE